MTLHFNKNGNWELDSKRRHTAAAQEVHRHIKTTPGHTHRQNKIREEEDEKDEDRAATAEAATEE